MRSGATRHEGTAFTSHTCLHSRGATACSHLLHAADPRPAAEPNTHTRTSPPHTSSPLCLPQCLGDFCDILRCPSWADSMLHSLRSGHAGCRGRELETRRHFCQHMVHDCVEHHRSGAAGSGAVGSGAAHALFEELDAHFCAPLNCEWREGLRLGHHRLDLPGSNASNGYYVLAALLLMAVSGVYFGLFCWYSATKAVSGDLRARRQRRTRCCGFLHKQKSY